MRYWFSCCQGRCQPLNIPLFPSWCCMFHTSQLHDCLLNLEWTVALICQLRKLVPWRSPGGIELMQLGHCICGTSSDVEWLCVQSRHVVSAEALKLICHACIILWLLNGGMESLTACRFLWYRSVSEGECAWHTIWFMHVHGLLSKPVCILYSSFCIDILERRKRNYISYITVNKR